MHSRLLAGLIALVVAAAACSSSADDSAGSEPQPDASATAEGDAPDPDSEAEADEIEADETEPVEPTPAPELFPENALIIGVISDQTGILKALDAPVLEAARVQVARINAQGGVLGRQLVLSEFDSRSQLNASYQAANQLVGDGVELFFVTCDFQFARPVIEIAAQEGKLVLSPCGGTPEWGNPAIAGRNVFSFAMPAVSEGRLIADYVLDRYGETVTMIVDATDPDSQRQCEAFEEKFRDGGGRFRGRLEVDLDSVRDIQDNIASLVRTSFELPAAVVLCAAPSVGQDIVLWLRRSGLEAPIVAGSAMDGDSWIVNVERTGEMVVLSYASVFGDDPDPAVAELIAEYEILTGERPSEGRPVTGADAIQAFALAAERAGSLELDALVAEFEAFDQQTLVAGTVSFSPEAHLSARSMRLMRIVDRVPQFVDIIDASGTSIAAPEPTPDEGPPPTPGPTPEGGFAPTPEPEDEGG